MPLPHKHTYNALGSHWEITVWDDMPSSRFDALVAEILKRSERFENEFSRFRPNSFVSWLAAEKRVGIIEVPRDFVAMLRPYFSVYEASGRKITPLIGNTLSDLGYDAEYSLTLKEIVRIAPDLLETVEILDESRIRLAYPVSFDFGAIGKGYFTDRIADFLRESAVRRFLVNGSGDIVYEGNGVPIRARLEDPRDETKAVGSIEITEGAFCASGTNRRRWRDFHHIVDPDTVRSPEQFLATWVRAERATWADLLATALFFASPSALQTVHPFEYATLAPDLTLRQSAGFDAETY